MVSRLGPALRELSTPRTILIVDDHVDSAEVIAQALELHGYETRVAYDPLGALSAAAEFRPQVAILDVDSSTLGGYELGAALHVDLVECRFIALTAGAASLNCLRSQ